LEEQAKEKYERIVGKISKDSGTHNITTENLSIKR